MATSANAAFFALPAAGTVEYIVLVQNTSPAPYAIYALLLDAHYNAPLVPPWHLAGIQPISGPPGWTELTGYSGSFLTGQTNFQGTAQSSGYILPGSVGTFVFQSSTYPPPATFPFGCAFWNGNNEWGFVYNGQAQNVICIPIEILPPFWHWQRPHKLAPEGIGTTAVTLGAEGEGPSVTLIYDKLGNVIKIIHNPPLPRKSSPR
jgi:hypothetical protein